MKPRKNAVVSFIRTIPSVGELHPIGPEARGLMAQRPITTGGDLHPALKQT